MTSTADHDLGALVLVDETQGITVIPQLAELRRLNWFDGKLLRADDLRIEQDHVRALVRRAARGGGHGVVHGLTCRLAADGRLRVGPGLAIDPGGRSLLLPVDVGLDVQDLIDRTAGRTPSARPAGAHRRPRALGRRFADDAFGDCVEPEPAGEAPVGGGRWYVVTVGWAEGLCGDEEVYGRLCEDACTTSTDRPWRIDGLVFRAHPLRPRAPLGTSSAVALSEIHERSLLASAVFADEQADGGSLISGDGLRSSVWCAGAAAPDLGHEEVPIGVLCRAGATTRFLDLWIARRERIETPPQRYWAGRLALRPWDVFLAQVLQFQCQLSDLLADGLRPGAPGEDPCAERQQALEETFAELERRVAAEAEAEAEDAEDPRVALLRRRVIALRTGAAAAGGARRILVDGGIVELPPAGYLPLDPAGPPSLEEQVRALLGPGVDLTFCTARHDAVARAFQEAQHLDRISLLRGLDDPARREDVEIVVPDAEIAGAAARDGWEGVLRIGERSDDAARELAGAGRVERRDGLALRWAGFAAGDDDGDARPGGGAVAAFGEVSTERDPFGLGEGERLAFVAAGDVLLGRDEDVRAQRASVRATFLVRSVDERPGGALVRGVLDGVGALRRIAPDGDETSEPFAVSRRPAELLRRQGDDGGTLAALRVQIDEGITATVTLEWAGDADTVELVAYTARGERDPEVRRLQPAAIAAAPFGSRLARLALDREPGAATAGHPARNAAEEALALLERAIREPDYARDAGRRLFPGAEDPGERLRATRDWVLFRRRAPLRCGPGAPTVPRVETVGVYGVPALRGPATRRIAGSGYAHVGDLEFTAGSSQIARGADALVRAWDDLVGQGVIPAAGALSGATGGDALALRRLDAVVDVLAAVSPRAEGYEARVLEAGQVPVDPEGRDGMLVVGFQPRDEPARTVGVAVVAISPQLVRDYQAGVDDGEFDAALKAAFSEPHRLGAVLFPEDSAEPADPADVDAVVERYREALGEQRIERVDVLSVEGDETAGDTGLRKARGTVVSDALGRGRGVQVLDVDAGAYEQAQDVKERTLVLVVPVT